MNILLVYPEFPDTFWSFKHALKFIKKKVSSQPLGLLTVAALLPKSWNIKLIDMNCKPLLNIDLEWADFVFLSAMSIQKNSVQRIIKQCNQVGTKIVAGGPLFTTDYEQYDSIDYFVLNEAEVTLSEFINDVEHGTPKHIYTSNEFADIKLSPSPMWELLDLKNYATLNIQYSRGCPYNCEFCNVTTLFGHIPRVKSSEQIINELDSLYKNGWRKNIFFVDDNFIGNKNILKKDLLPALINWQKGKKGISFNTEASINLADDDELVALMVKAGFDTVFIGIETPDEGSLAECNKKQNINRNMLECVQKLQRAGLQVQGGFILGFDNDNHSSFQNLVDFIQKSGIVTAMVGLLQAPTDTILYKRLLKENRILAVMDGDNVDGTTNIIPMMDIEKLSSGYKQVMNQLYSPKLYNKRIKTFLKEYKTPKLDINFGLKNLQSNVLALCRSVYILGILDKQRRYYWNLFWWTLLRKPAMMGLSITFAVYGYHFRIICEKHIQ